MALPRKLAPPGSPHATFPHSMTRTHLAAVLAPIALVLAQPALADEPCDRVLVTTGLDTWSEELARLASLAPGLLAPRSDMLRRGGMSARPLCGRGDDLVWGDRYVSAQAEARLQLVPPRLLLAYQSLAPGGSNDGLLWQGRGFSTLLSGGLRGTWNIFSAQLAPEVTWAQNRSFALADTGQTGRLRYANPWYGDALDLPQRFGDGSFARVGFGQSYLAVEKYGARLALSTENLWWGPGIRHALLLTNTAEGFPHLSLGTSRPVDIWIGMLEAELVLGRLERTKYLTRGYRPFFNGLAVTFEPRWIPGLYLGAGRVFVEDERTLSRNGYLSVFQPTSQKKAGDNPSDNQILSTWFRWVMPEIELYGEYALDDYPSLAGLSRIPDRAAAWTLGVQKRWVRGERWWRVVGELAKTRSNLPPGAATSFYTHSGGADYTNRGQLLGDWIGPGADAQYLAVDAFTPSGRFGGYFERVRRNEEIFWSRFADSATVDHDAEVVVGLRQVLFTHGLEIGWDAAVGHRFNRDFVQRYSPTFRAMLTVAMPLGHDLAPRAQPGAPEESAQP
jgi:hypothetical protein